MTDEEPEGQRTALELTWNAYWNAYMKLIPSFVWFYGVAVLPFILIVAFRGWDETFRTGEAYLYLIGVTIAVVGENVIELFENGTRGLKELGLYDWSAAIYSLAPVLAAAAWGAVLVVTQPKIHHPTTSWVQVVVFFVSLIYLLLARFSFKGKKSLMNIIESTFVQPE